MTKTYVLAAILAATLSGSAFAQSYDPDYGTGNVTPLAQVPVDQGMHARAQVLDGRHQAIRPAFTKSERALFNRIPRHD